MSKKEIQPVPLRSLPDGALFEVVGLETLFRNLEVQSVTDCATAVEGEKLTSEKGEGEKWLRFSSTMANSTTVRMTGFNEDFVPDERVQMPKSKE